MQVDQPELLRSTNNTVIWLRPSPVVAKIAPKGDNRLSWEHAIASSLYRCGGPVVGPFEIGGLAVHTSDGLEMTLWPYNPQDGSRPSPAAMADALQAMHRAVDRVAEEERLPSWHVGPQDVLSRLEDRSFASTLEERDRRLLRSALARYPEIPSTSASIRGLHGSPTPSMSSWSKEKSALLISRRSVGVRWNGIWPTWNPRWLPSTDHVFRHMRWEWLAWW